MSAPSVEERDLQKAETQGASWSLQVATALGIPIRIHFTFLLLLVWYGFATAAQGGRVFPAIVFLLLVFTCVVLHELGHAGMAKRFGVRTREIVLYPIGGIARLENIPTGVAELLIALAGPAVNLVLAVFLVVLMIATDTPLSSVSTASFMILSGRDVVPNLLRANLFLFLFNLIPAFPMDGGRVLRALLTLGMAEDRATDIAATVGQGIAILFGAWGMFQGNIILMFIALFVFVGAGQEAAFYRRRALVLGRAAREAMITKFETLAPQDSLARAAERLLATHQQDFPVVDAWKRVVGVLPRATLLKGLAKEGNSGAVLDTMQREFPAVRPDTDLEEVLRILQTNPGTPVLVNDDHGLVGMITLENLAEFIEIARVKRAASA